MDALNAMEVLTGRQIDFEKGSILKAEMAKKNLHTKKTMMNMYYPTSSIKNSCMQYHNMMPDNVTNCMNFNNNNLCNQLLKDDSNIYQLNNLNRGMNLPANAGMGPLANNGRMSLNKKLYRYILIKDTIIFFSFINFYTFKIKKKLLKKLYYFYYYYYYYFIYFLLYFFYL